MKDWDLIKDRSLFNQFFKLAQTVSQDDIVSAGKKLVSMLEKEYSNQPNITTATNSDLDINNLHSFDDLINYLNTSKLSIDGIRAVLTEEEVNTIPDNLKAQYQLASDTTNLYFNTKVLSEYIAHLQNKALQLKESNPPEGQILEVLVGKIVDHINLLSPNSKLARTSPKADPKSANNLADNTPLDYFDSKNFDPLNPTNNMGEANAAFILTAKDLKNRNTLNAWLQNSQLIINRQAIQFGKPTFDYCAVMHVLFLRAKQRRQGANTEDIQRNSEWYIKQISTIAQTFESPDGSACNVTSYNAKNPERPNIATENNPNLINEMARNVVFTSDAIHLDKIAIFVRNYYNLTVDPKAGGEVEAARTNLNASFQKIEQDIKNLQGYISSPTSISLSSFQTPQTMQARFGANPKPMFVIITLLDILNNAKDVYYDFVDRFSQQIQTLEIENKVYHGAFNFVQGQKQIAESNYNTLISAQNSYQQFALQK